MRIKVLEDFSTSVHQKAKDFVADLVKLDFEHEMIPIQDPPLTEYEPGKWGIDFTYIAGLQNLQPGEFLQLMHHNIEPEKNLISWARFSYPGTAQISQIAGLGDPEVIAMKILHELSHSFHFYLGIPDVTHDYTESTQPRTLEQYKLAHRDLYQRLQSFLREDNAMLDQFIKKYAGKRIDFDGNKRYWCVDLYRFYVKEVLHLPQTPGVRSAYQIWTTAGANFRQITTGLPESGDIIIWGNGISADGHVAVCVSATPTSIKVFEQNNPIGKPCRVWDHSYKYVIGWLRPVQLMQEKGKDMLIQLEGSAAVSYLSGKKIRHDLSERAWWEYFDGSPPDVVATHASYNSFPVGRPIFYSPTFGEAELGADTDVWTAEPQPKQVE